MFRLISKFMIVCLFPGLVVSISSAQLPSAATSVLSGNFIAVEGSTGGLPDNCADGRCGNYLIIVNDAFGAPIGGTTVWIDFSACPDIQTSCDQLTAVTGQTEAVPKSVFGVTSPGGAFVFRVQGASNATPPGPNTSPGTNAGVPCATVWAQSLPPFLPGAPVPLGNLVVSAYDINGLGSPTTAVNALDVSLVQAEALKVAGGGTARARDDYNFTNTVSAADVGISSTMALQQAAGTGSKVTGPYCP